MSMTNILPICVWCDIPKIGKKHKRVTDAIKDMPKILTTIEDGNIYYTCLRCGAAEEILIDKNGKQYFDFNI